MLRKLHIENYVLIDSLDIEFPEGLSIITGQTGAGKSILLGALGLLLGAKADASHISEGASGCVVEGEFDNPDGIRDLLDEAGAEWDPDGLTIRRVLSSSGRSRSFVNDCPVQAALLSELSSKLVDIHSQDQTRLLRDRAFQLSVLDYFAGASADVQACREAWRRLGGLDSELEKLRLRRDSLREEADYNAAQYEQLSRAGLQEGELEELESEQKQLENAESIKEAFALAGAAFEPSEASSIDSALKEAGRQLDKISSYVPGTAELSERLHSARIELSDIRESIAELDSKVSLSQDRLEFVNERISLIYSLLQKYHCADVGELIDRREAFSKSIEDNSSVDERIASLEKERAAAQSKHSALCARIHEARVKAAPAFEQEILASLRFLELDRAAFGVRIDASAPGPDGSDAVSFTFSASGAAPADLAKAASGGEVSRIMLSLKALLARFTGMPTMIFDEIDTGVSGSAADKMGTMICRMGENMQVIAITHLPQVAAKGNAHFVVSKSMDDKRAVSGIRRVEGEERVMEIARLLSGSSITAEAAANARILIGRPEA